MAAGEYVSVSSQADSERADLTREKKELAQDWDGETQELAGVYQHRGLDQTLASQVAVKLMQHDALGAHMRDELGLSNVMVARPVQAALSSAIAFATGASMPVTAALIVPTAWMAWGVSGVSVVALAVLGIVSACAGGAPPGRSAVRVTFWGIAAMVVTGAVGHLAGAVG